MSGWREALVRAASSGLTATGITGGARLSGGFKADAIRLQVFKASSASLAAATKLGSEPTALAWDCTHLTTGQTRWYWLCWVSAEGNLSAFAGPVSGCWPACQTPGWRRSGSRRPRWTWRGWTNNTVRVMARHISGATFGLATATLSVQLVKRRVP